MNRRSLIKKSGLFFTLPSLGWTATSGQAAAQSLEPRDLIFNLRIQDRKPAFLTSQVRRGLEEALASGKRLRVLAGGHGYIGQALARDGIVIDMRGQRQVTVDEQTGWLHAQAGARFIEVYRALTARGELKYVLPTGDCPTVGVAGYTLGGGYGHLSRRFGMMCDNVVAMKVLVVDRESRIVEKLLTPSSTGEDAELFWALRGGGSARFGIVSDFYFQLREKPRDLKVYDIRLRWDLQVSEIAEVIRIWKDWLAQHIDDPTLSSKLALGSGWYHISGLSSQREPIYTLKNLLDRFINQQESAYELPYEIQSLTRAFKQCSSLDECEVQPKKAFAAKSAFMQLSDLDRDPGAIARLLVSRRQQYGNYGGIELMAWRMQGGLFPSNAFVHRDHDLLCQFYTEGYESESDPWMRSLFRALTGADENSAQIPGYQNYTDASISGADSSFPSAYFPGAQSLAADSASLNVKEALERVRGRYHNVFG